jgi:hypothetical protein
MGVVGNNVKLKKFPPKASIEDLNLKIHEDHRDYNVHKYGDVEKRKSEKVPTEKEIDDIKKSDEFKKSIADYPKSGCFANVWITSNELFKEGSIFTNLYGITSELTLTLIPLVFPETSSVKTILTDVTNGKVLKEYKLKERSYHIVSLNPLAWLFTIGHDGHGGSENSGEYAKQMAQEKLFEAMLRQVTNDAHQFVECRK